MKFTYSELKSALKIKSEESTIVDQLFVSRSAIAIKANNNLLPIFGFGVAFDRRKSEATATYELLEHIIFLPYAHNKDSLNKPAVYRTERLKAYSDQSIQPFLIGMPTHKGVFTANGCAIATNIHDAARRSKRELLERHLCCEIWYDQTRPLFSINDSYMNTKAQNIDLKFYTTTSLENKFAIAALDCSEFGFFALGAAIRQSIQEACIHAAGEVIMLYEDMKKERSGISSTRRSQRLILSLRDKTISQARKSYFSNLLNKPAKVKHHTPLDADTICFEPLPSIYAARSFSADVLDPRQFETMDNVPILPLF